MLAGETLYYGANGKVMTIVGGYFYIWNRYNFNYKPVKSSVQQPGSFLYFDSSKSYAYDTVYVIMTNINNVDLSYSLTNTNSRCYFRLPEAYLMKFTLSSAATTGSLAASESHDILKAAGVNDMLASGLYIQADVNQLADHSLYTPNTFTLLTDVVCSTNGSNSYSFEKSSVNTISLYGNTVQVDDTASGYYISTGSTASCGTARNEQVSDLSKSAYPSNGAHTDGYWYILTNG